MRERLEKDGPLYEGYHPRMRVVHERNADRLAESSATSAGLSPISSAGSVACGVVGGAHAISRPALMRAILPLLTRTSGVPRSEGARMEDRILVFEGRPQRFGTAFDWDEHGEMSPLPIEEPDEVDRYRRSRLAVAR